jgi:Xaa-Pro dipeptidase
MRNPEIRIPHTGTERMPSRRHFLWSSAAAMIVGRASAAGAAPQRGRGQRSTDDTPVPPSVAALTSMRDQARPISNDERRARIGRAKQLMSRSKIDALLLTGGTSMAYFANMRWGGSERLFAVVIPVKGEPFFVCPAFEVDRAQELITLGPFGSGTPDIRSWQEDESPFVRVAEALKDRGIATGRLGVEETAKFVFADSIAHAAPQLRVVSGTPITAGCRMIKDAHEIELMRLASRATLRVYEAVFRGLEPGMTQNTVANLIAEAYHRVGFPGEASVQVGEYTALPHGSIRPQVIREGTIIMIDDGCTVEGYQSDITRTFVLGKATDKMQRVFAIVKDAQTAALKAARPGVPLHQLDAVARKVVVDAGYGPGFTYFTHRLGHGIGMDGHEWPYLVKNNMYGWTQALDLQPGMVFSDEPGIYIRGEFGVRLEDDLHITDDGAELFTPQSESLEKPF